MLDRLFLKNYIGKKFIINKIWSAQLQRVFDCT